MALPEEKIMSFTTSLSYGTLFGGPFTGAVAFQICFSGNVAVENELSELILNIQRYPQGKQKLVRMSGDFTQANELDLFTFVKAMKDAKYTIQAISNGQQHHSWFSMLSWLIVEIGDEMWPGFLCNELHYKLSQQSSGEEPIHPTDIPVKYIVPQEGVEAKRIMDFVKNAKGPWGILSRQRFYMEV
jgi:hypothetical protein